MRSTHTPSPLAVQAVLLCVAALMEASRPQAWALNAKRYAANKPPRG